MSIRNNKGIKGLEFGKIFPLKRYEQKHKQLSSHSKLQCAMVMERNKDGAA